MKEVKEEKADEKTCKWCGYCTIMMEQGVAFCFGNDKKICIDIKETACDKYWFSDNLNRC